MVPGWMVSGRMDPFSIEGIHGAKNPIRFKFITRLHLQRKDGKTERHLSTGFQASLNGVPGTETESLSAWYVSVLLSVCLTI